MHVVRSRASSPFLILGFLAALAVAGPVAAAGEEEKPAADAGGQAAAQEAAGEVQGVPWIAFGPQAFERARQGQRPILLYLSALWEYHDGVMARVTYGEPRVQQLLAERYVPIRVDADERPDLFNRFGMGSWPSSAVILYDGHPFYFPAESMKTVRRAGGAFFPPDVFFAYFSQLADHYERNRKQVHQLAQETDNRILMHRTSETGELSRESLEVVVGALLDHYGSRGRVPVEGSYHPDFPMVRLALYYWSLKSDRQVLDMALDHLVDMSRGGIHDRVGGGFFRTAHDSLFIVPSFEKLPAVNAAALDAYLDTWQATGHPAYLAVARGVLEHVREHGWNPASHSFTGAMAAWTEGGGNGDYYTWTDDELKAILTEEEFAVASAAYDIRPVGDLKDTAPRRNVIFLAEGPIMQSQRTGMPVEKVQEILEAATDKMKAARSRRVAPPVDQRVFADWSGRMISAFLHAARATLDPEAGRTALEALEILTSRCRLAQGLIAHVCQPAEMENIGLGFLTDQARVMNALVDAYEYTGRERYLTEAQGIAERVVSLFGDVTTGGFTDAVPDPEAPGLLAWPFRDMLENMALAEGLLRLGLLVGDEGLVKEGRKAVESWADDFGSLARHSASFALASQMYINPPLEILVAGGAGEGEAAARIRERALRTYHPWRIVRHWDIPRGKSELTRRGMEPLEGTQVAFCIGSDCGGPFPPDADMREKLAGFLSRENGKAGPQGSSP